MASFQSHRGQRDKNNREQSDHGSTSSSSHQSRNPEVSTASMSSKETKDDQVSKSTEEQTVKTEDGEKAGRRSRRFSRGRKQKGQSIGSSSAADRRQAQSPLNDPVPQNVQSVAIVERGALSRPVTNRGKKETPNHGSNNLQDVTTDQKGAQGTTHKTRKRRKENKRDGDRNENPVLQNRPQDNAAEGDIEGHDESHDQKQTERHLQNKPEGNKSVKAIGSVKRMLKQKMKKNVTPREESIKSEDQERHQNTSKPSITIAKEHERKGLSETRIQRGTTPKADEQQPDEAQKLGKSRGRTENAALTKSNNTVSQNSQLQDSQVHSDSQNTIQGIVAREQCVVMDSNNNFLENKERGGETEIESKAGKGPSIRNQKLKQTSNKFGSLKKPPTIKAMREFLEKSPEDIVNWLISDHSSLFKEQRKMKDEAVALLVRLLAKACDCESNSDMAQLCSAISTSWFLRRRVVSVLDQVVAKESRGSQTKHFSSETVNDIAKVQQEIFKRSPTPECPLLKKLHGLVSSRRLLDQDIISAVKEQKKLLKKQKVAQIKQEAVQKRQLVSTVRTAVTDDNKKPPQNFRELSIIPTREDIISNGGQEQELFLRRNKVRGRYNNEEHYLDVQFRLLREDFLRPLRNGIQQLMSNDILDDTGDVRVEDVRVYKNVRIMSPVCTSNGVAFKIRFDVASFCRVRWENSKRLIFGSLLCLSKDDFKSFAFATVANRELNNIRKGEIEVRFVSPSSEAGLHTGDSCQMVESIAFFEAYRPVLEGLKMILPGEFPLQRYIVKCEKNVQPPGYLTQPDGHHAVFDFSAIMTNEESVDHKSTSACLPKGKNHSCPVVSGSRVSVLDPASWPSAQDLKLDESQFNALQLALTKEFAVIQGPPGTGKTYIGLKIAKVLLQNKTVWNGETGGPILVVCYTNHALDQFLEGIHAFHPDGIVRVGGRSKSETIQECSLTKLKKIRMEQRLTPASIRQAFGQIRQEMKNLSEMIDDHEGMLDELSRTVLHEDELVEYSMAQEHYDSLKRGFQGTAGEKKESVIPHWLGLPVQPADPYQGGFCQPLAMFPFNAECRGLEYFSQEDVAYLSRRVQDAPGADGSPGGSLELTGSVESYIEIPNLWGGFADAGRSITLLAFIYPMGEGGPIISYDIHGYGVQMWHEGFHGTMGILSACFIRRDLMDFAPPLRAAVLNINEWNFIGASYDHESGNAHLWHNGNEVQTACIGESFDLATQFPLRIGALESPWLGHYFAGRISHLHIYAEALTAENIRAVGGMPLQERYTLSEEDDEQTCTETGGSGKGDGEDNNRELSADFQFDADVLQGERILDTEDVIRFDPEPPSDYLKTSDISEDPVCAHGGVQSGNWQFQNPNRIKQKIKRIIQRELKREDMMSEEEASKVENVWNLSEKDRWRLYRRWMCDARKSCLEYICNFQELFDDQVLQLKEVRKQEECEILRNADIIGMTTTGAARYHGLLQDIQPAITIVEEAAEVFEAHIVTSLTKGSKHLILIGDHQQLRPNPTVYDLQQNYHLDVSLFERMVENGIMFSRLSLQHRMRPEIAKMVKHIYVNPKLENHESVLSFENIRGVERNLFFVDHSKKERFISEGKSKSNAHEAKFLTALCRYFIQQGYQPSQITILTAYSGQLVEFRKEMMEDKTFFEGVRVTAVDNFQGEESDIILLSLVRSERIGFLKIANRVCVALSRARKGFYIIGNATLLAEEDPNLWANIITDMHEDGNLGSELKLVCQNHPQNVIHASSAEDFENSPEGGCNEQCAMKLECGHVCNKVCHPIDLEHKVKFACQKPCTKTICDLQHICPRTCGEECGPCMERVPKVIPECNHEQLVPCSVDPATFKCMEMVSKRAVTCGHINKVECCVASTDIICKEPCGALECGHQCNGYCNRCQEGRLHLPCKSSCSRTLFCGHTCADICVKSCPPCSAPCRNYCDHQPCGRSCSDPCEPCPMECTWQCPHYKCTKPCGQICDRPRCDQPCSRQLPCGHSCVGVCGDVCPSLCRVCQEAQFSESAPGAVFVELIDCGHVIEVGKLDKWMDGRDEADAEGGNADVKIKHKGCPTCHTPILYSRRYGNIVKKIHADFEVIKRRVFLAGVTSINQIQRIRREVREVEGIQKELLEDIDKCVTSGRLSCEEVHKYQNQVTFLKFLGSLITKHKVTKESSSELFSKINLLKARVMMRDCFSAQELHEFQEELSRTELLVCFRSLMTALESKSVHSLCPKDARTVESIRNALDSGEVVANQKIEEFLDDINKIKQNQRFSMKVEINNCGTELRDKIVTTNNLTQGPWYKCGSKGHIFSAAECSKSESSIRCPDCLAAAIRTAQQNTEAVPTPVKLSELMNMTFKHGFVTSAKQRRRKRPGKTSKAQK